MIGMLTDMAVAIGVTGVLIVLTVGFISPTVMLLGAALVVVGWALDGTQLGR